MDGTGKNYIREWRKFRGLTQAQVSDRLYSKHNMKLTEASISRLERGKQNYTQTVLEAIADVLGCAPADLLVRDPGNVEGVWSVWDTIPNRDKPRALEILRAFADTSEKKEDQEPGKKLNNSLSASELPAKFAAR